MNRPSLNRQENREQACFLVLCRPWPDYLGLVEVARNWLRLIYDRDPEQPPADANDLSRVYVLPVEVGQR